MSDSESEPEPRRVAQGLGALNVDGSTVSWTLEETDCTVENRNRNNGELTSRLFRLPTVRRDIRFFLQGQGERSFLSLDYDGHEAVALRYELKVGEQRHVGHDVARKSRFFMRGGWRGLTMEFGKCSRPTGGAVAISLTILSAHTARDVPALLSALRGDSPEGRATAQKVLLLLLGGSDPAAFRDLTIAAMEEVAAERDKELRRIRAIFESSPADLDECKQALTRDLLTILGTVNATDQLTKAMALFEDSGADTIKQMMQYGKPQELVDSLELKPVKRKMLMEKMQEYAKDGTSPASPAGDFKRNRVLISARFDGGPFEDSVRRIASKMEQLGSPIYIVKAGTGDDFGDYTNKGLFRSFAIVAMCSARPTKPYGEKTESAYCTYAELNYWVNHMKDVKLIPVQLADEFPPTTPEEAGTSQNDVALRPCVVRVDGRNKPEDDLAKELHNAVVDAAPAELSLQKC